MRDDLWVGGWVGGGESPMIGRAHLRMRVKVSTTRAQNVQCDSAQRGDLCRRRLRCPSDPPTSAAFLLWYIYFWLTVALHHGSVLGPVMWSVLRPVWVWEEPLPSPKYPPGHFTMHLMLVEKGMRLPGRTTPPPHYTAWAVDAVKAECTQMAGDQR